MNMSNALKERKIQPGCWKIDSQDEACYIDIEEDNTDDPGREYSQWNNLPDLLLEEIFSYLSVRERYYASLVCRNWYSCFYLPRVWSNFLVDDQTLTRQRYNYYSGWQHILDHLRTQSCFTKVGRYIKGLDFRPLHSFNNLFQFMTLISWCMEQSRKPGCTREIQGIGDKIKSLNYIFPCNMAAPDDPEGVKLFGTGGQLLAALKRLMSVIKNLQTLRLIDLMLDRYEAKHLLDEVIETSAMELRFLNLVNVTTIHCPIMHVGLFFNLKVLIISPQNIDDDVILLLADSRVRHLHLFQNRYTPSSISITSCSGKAWRTLKRDNPKLMVHLRVESTSNAEIVLQPEAPVHSVLYQTPKTQITSERLVQIVDMYKTTLAIYGHELLPRFISPKSFNNRVDSLLVLMARQCPNLGILIIREKVSTSTLLLIAKAAINLRHLHVRKNCVILKCDWPKNPDWSNEFYQWLRTTSQSYENTELEISQILGHRWTMMSDRIFKQLSVNVRQEL